MSEIAAHKPEYLEVRKTGPLRMVTAASLFDGHDAAINIMRRLIQDRGVEVVHLGHNRSVEEVVRAALQEDADAIAISSYQGGHVEYFKFLVDSLRDAGAEHIKVFGGGGGTITHDEISALHDYGVERIYHPDDGLAMGLEQMIDDLVERIASDRGGRLIRADWQLDSDADCARFISVIEENLLPDRDMQALVKYLRSIPAKAPVVGLTGTGGAGKSSVTDELLNRFLAAFPDKKIAVLAVDPSRRRSGGALLGDRIRMNSLRDSRVFMHSLATRRANLATSSVLQQCIDYLRRQDYGLVLVETAGIGQSDSEIVDLVDFSIYVMTSEFGAPSQLEKIDMLDFADLVVLNKFDRQGSEDALRDIRKQWRRNHLAFDLPEDELPVQETIASRYNDPGVTRLFDRLCDALVRKLNLPADEWQFAAQARPDSTNDVSAIPAEKSAYLADIARDGRSVNEYIGKQAAIASEAWQSWSILADKDPDCPDALESYPPALLDRNANSEWLSLRRVYQDALQTLDPEGVAALRNWPERKASYRSDEYVYTVRDREIRGDNYRTSLSHTRVPKIALPASRDWGEVLAFLFMENLPGHYPYTAGVYPYRRQNEDPTRMFAGEGTPERTNRRFHYLASGTGVARLSTAFDSVTLYGENPDLRPDIYGKVGNSGVSIATLDDMKKLFSGFDLCAPETSVSMTINGPAPMILAMFMNAAIDQQVEKYLKEYGQWEIASARIEKLSEAKKRPVFNGDLPAGNNGLGLGLLGVNGADLVDEKTYADIRAKTLSQVRGTVQADILKEDQAQNTCIFSIPFAMRMMADVQESFIRNKVRNYYSVSISGYHIAEAGANPISQLAFTLANGFTLVEYYLSRGMKIDDFAPNLSFFFSNGMDPEYAVIGRVARRIWARAMRNRYGASRRSQMLKYHIQTSGRSLHAQEMQFNDIRTTLQAVYAIFDNCNSLHTNAYDEAVTTPTEASVRRALAIQMIINRELGLNVCENPFQGSWIIEELTRLVEEAVYQEFESLSARGGVLGAMDTMYQRSKIQDESLYYEKLKHSGELAVIGVNTFKSEGDEGSSAPADLMRSSTEEKQQQLAGLEIFHALHKNEVETALKALQQCAVSGANLFDELMMTTRCCSLGQISHALYQVGGAYRRSM